MNHCYTHRSFNERRLLRQSSSFAVVEMQFATKTREGHTFGQDEDSRKDGTATMLSLVERCILMTIVPRCSGLFD